MVKNYWEPRIIKERDQLVQLYPTLCDPLDCSPPGSSVHGILQTRTIKWVAISYSNTGFPGGSEVKASASDVGDLGSIPGLGRSPGEGNVYYMCVLVTQLCPTLSDPMDCSPPGYSVHGILQARILEWIVMPSSRDQTHISYTSYLGRLFLYH